MTPWAAQWLKWATPITTIAGVALAFPWYGNGPKLLQSGSTQGFRTIYRSRPRAVTVYVLGVVASSYCSYVLVGRLAGKIGETEAVVHLVCWTLLPPLFFYFEWFFWFDNHESEAAVAALRAGQDLAGQLWAAVLAVLASQQVVDAIGKLSPKSP